MTMQHLRYLWRYLRRLTGCLLLASPLALSPAAHPAAQQAPAKPAAAKPGSAKPMPAAAAAPPPAAAAAPAPQPAAELPINITADSGIEWQQNQQVYIARGNAIATRGPGEVDADTITAHYREVKGGTGNTGNGNSEIYRIEADGNVTIKRENQTVVGDHADYDVDQGIGIVHGKALKMTTTNDVVTARDALEWYDPKQIMVARGDAVAVHSGRTIKADVLTAYMIKSPEAGGQPAAGAKPTPAAKPGAAPPPGKPGAQPANGEASKLNRLDGQGHVVVIDGLDVGRGDYGVYNAQTGICTLLGNVTLTRDKDVVTGQYAVMDLNKNVSRIMPASSVAGATRQRVQGMFVRQDQHPAGQTPPAKTP